MATAVLIIMVLVFARTDWQYINDDFYCVDDAVVYLNYVVHSIIVGRIPLSHKTCISSNVNEGKHCDITIECDLKSGSWSLPLPFTLPELDECQLFKNNLLSMTAQSNDQIAPAIRAFM